jgi:nucleoside-triphosphatase
VIGERKRPVCLLTGGPGTGKTTIIKEALARTNIRAGGFYSEEIRDRGVRQGFRIVTLDGESAVLAHTNIAGPYRVGKYSVNLEGLEETGVAAVKRERQP